MTDHGGAVRSAPRRTAPDHNDPSPTPTAGPASKPSAPCWAVIAGGGTIGHLTPGLAAAEALVAAGCPKEAIHFVGSARGVEATRLPATGFGVTLLPGRGIQRRLTLDNLGALWGLGRAFGQALGLLRRLRPAVVLATGGYASAPCALAATLLRIPVVVAEQNAVPGAANRLAVRLGAKASAVSFDGTPLARAVTTGNPVRPEMLAVDRSPAGRAAARAALGVPEDRVLVVAYGGSLGARRLNEALLAARAEWADRSDLALRHVIGDRDWDRFAELAGPRPGEALLYQPVRYEEAMPRCFAAADLVIGRAGATTVADLAAVGLGSLLVPLPGAPGDHQSANAAVLARAGAAVVVPDSEADGARLAAEVDALLAEPGRLVAMAAAAGGLGRRDAARRVADLVVTHARRPLPAAGDGDGDGDGEDA